MSSTGAVIFLHGSGDSGPGAEAWISHVDPKFVVGLRNAGVKIVFPSAKARPYTMAGGGLMPVWHDRLSLAGDAEEDEVGLAETGRVIAGVVAELVESGTPQSKIVLGGFSQGGGTAIYTALAPGITTQFAGVFSMSSWVTTKSQIWPRVSQMRAHAQPLPPVWMAHGSDDPMIDARWGEATRDQLIAAGGKVEWLMERGIGHNPGPLGLLSLQRWILETLGPM
eukprot:m.108994 g.108994  ORF g.108994 m.108994 type:complete len:224 (+) comp27923_c0_seq6:142-813(+)